MEFLLDLHVHSSASPCSVLTADVVVRDARAAGIHGIALVDHETLPAGETLRSIAAAGIAVYPGLELSTAYGDLLIFGTETPPPYRDPERLVAWVHRRGGAAVLAHPFRSNRPAGVALWRVPGLAVEAHNGRCSAEENRWAAAAAADLERPMTAGSDAHRPGEVGSGATVLPHRPADARELAALLRSGTCRSLALREQGLGRRLDTLAVVHA